MHEPTTYEIVIRGRAGRRLLRPLLDDFEYGLAGGETRLVGIVRDSAHLHGVVAHLTSVNAELISIAPVDPALDNTSHHNTSHHNTSHHNNSTSTWRTQQ